MYNGRARCGFVYDLTPMLSLKTHISFVILKIVKCNGNNKYLSFSQFPTNTTNNSRIQVFSLVNINYDLVFTLDASRIAVD